ncbi:19104_t:CDS:2, partial [Gigaspora rosea]
MGKKSSNPINSQMKKKAKASKNLTSTLFETQQIKLKINPIVIISLFILLISIVIAWGKYRQQALCQILTSDYEDKILWISVPDHKNTKDYVSLDNGAFVYRHIYMDEFEKEFNVKPLHFPIIDPVIADFLASYNLRARILNNTELSQEFVSSIFSKSEKWAPIIEDTKFRVGNGTYVDDERVYVRWVNDIVKWGMFASRTLQPNELIGIYTGFITRHPDDVEYAWEFNYLADVLDNDGEIVRTCIDGKYMGNYLRFANHRDANHNVNEIYAIYDDIWYVLYIAQEEIK